MTATASRLTRVITCPDGLPLGLDLYRPDGGRGDLPLTVLCHGFKGFRRWGMFPPLAERLAAGGRAVALVDLSHNGTAPGSEEDFTRLDLFEAQTPTRHVADLRLVMHELSRREARTELGLAAAPPSLVGHSMGGGVAVVLAGGDVELAALATLNGISHFLRVTDGQLQEMETTGRVVFENGRTGQRMPLGRAWFDEGGAFDMGALGRAITCPSLVIQGEADPVVTPDEGASLAAWIPGATLLSVPGADHTFGGRHPWAGWTPELERVSTALDDHLPRITT